MALRAFHSNPSIGGFGNENSTTQLLGNPTILNKTTDGDSTDKNAHSDPHDSSDALCQIVKELVENAIDACQTAQKDSSRDHTVCRVKVEILPYRNHEKSPPTLQVTVSDNGCGMKDIQACVNAFQSSKGGSSNTAGRYGIGLTLCLLHAQRLVSGTYSCITSATKEAHNFKRALFFVNTVGDSIECHREEDVEKGHATESGTCVSLLVPVSEYVVLSCIEMLSSFLPSSISQPLPNRVERLQKWHGNVSSSI
jgi:DNA topoisomerase VI subunit B